ncbi:sushi, von Willebrand factor type A, EGF and pentraxin domain-containing protein 1-like [Ruditapes philippinarum]|uniref:sushi, von Willebrand factor type A, EGF and pentraxin domain-containing protein 1-like n=1 Tax=Ruditapes philippinarum TaxID=129788 RepID=UPI00295BF541|nr:sushi, von Willebrand factor type A, EGF and pentraxin domain-containing protein 1-like [Ruditapes philippinarum]
MYYSMLYTVVYLTPVVLVLFYGVTDAAQASTWEYCNCTFTEWQTWGDCTEECFGQRVRERGATYDDEKDGCNSFTDCATPDERFEWGSCNTVCENNGSPTGNLTFPCTCALGYYGSCCTLRVDCGEPEGIINGLVSFTTTDYDSPATYSCNTLYNLTNGDEVRYCQDNFTWGGIIPECISVDHCSSTPCMNSATCVDLIGDFRCDCDQGWTGDICDVDIQPPVVDGCPENVELNATQSTALYTWIDPVFTDPMGTELNITSSHASSTYRFPWGDHTVSYLATKLLNGLQTNCSFNVKVRPTPCDDLNIPVHGARMCNGWRTDYGRFCMMSCLQNYTLGPAYSFRTWRTCGATGTWVPSVQFPDCSLRVYSVEDAVFYQPEYESHVHESSCTDANTQSALKQLYITKLNQHFGLSSFCSNNQADCTADNVEVECYNDV